MISLSAFKSCIKANEKLAVLALSYAMILYVEWVDGIYTLKHGEYYILCGLTSFILFFICNGSKDKLLNIYSYIQLISLCFYTCMIDMSIFEVVEPYFYDGIFNLPHLNYSSVIILYEIILLITGLANVHSWLHNGINLHNSRNHRV